jgi:hypothetical protein
MLCRKHRRRSGPNSTFAAIALGTVNPHKHHGIKRKRKKVPPKVPRHVERAPPPLPLILMLIFLVLVLVLEVLLPSSLFSKSASPRGSGLFLGPLYFFCPSP